MAPRNIHISAEWVKGKFPATIKPDERIVGVSFQHGISDIEDYVVFLVERLEDEETPKD